MRNFFTSNKVHDAAGLVSASPAIPPTVISSLTPTMSRVHSNDIHLSGIGAPILQNSGNGKTQLAGACSLMMVVPITAASIVLTIVICCLAPMSALWFSSLNSLTKTCTSSLTDEINVYRSLLVDQTVGTVSSELSIPPMVGDLVRIAIPESAYNSTVPVHNDSSAFQLICRALVDQFPVNNLIVAWVNTVGEQLYSDWRDSWGYYDSSISSNLTLFALRGNTFTTEMVMAIPDYNLPSRDWWNLGLTAWNGSWTSVYLSANANDGRVIAYTLRPRLSVPVVIQITFTLAFLQDFFMTFNLTTNGLAFLTENPSLKIIAGTAGLPMSLDADIFAPNCSVLVVRETCAQWLYSSSFAESHFTMTIAEDLTYVDVVPIRVNGGLLLWLFLVTPEKDFMASINEEQDKAVRDSRMSLWIVLSAEFFIGLLAIAISVGLSIVLAQALGDVIKKLQRVSRGQITKSDSNADLKNSILQEIDSLNSEVTRMQAALESFSQYVPTQVVRYLCKNNMKPIIGVSTMRCTVMFLDVVDFTQNMEKHGAQSIIEILSAMFESFSTIITRHNGCIDKYIGDAIMALWGCPVIDHNSEFHACKAVADILDSLSKLNMIFTAKSLPTMRVRIGLHSGEVKAGNVGSSHRLNYTVLGNTVNLASRLEPLNKELGTSVLVSDSIRDAAKTHNVFSWRALGHIKVRGFKHPVLVHEFLGLTSALTQEKRKLIAAYQPLDTLLYSKVNDIDQSQSQSQPQPQVQVQPQTESQPQPLNQDTQTEDRSTTPSVELADQIAQAMTQYLDENPSDYTVAQARLKLLNLPAS
ncbi:adenylate/guanilate cyclase [Pelomyxa schiedti]|nr:adenylate/guanilate cyclase [Pelomyxa schiedti]